MTDEQIIEKLYEESKHHEEIVMDDFIENLTGLSQDTPECQIIIKRIWKKCFSDGYQTISEYINSKN